MKTVGIIGGSGKMGSAFFSYFQKKSMKVIKSDINTELSNIELAKKSDIVIISVNIEHTKKVIKEITPHLKKDAILSDFTSIKKDIINEMKNNFSGNIVGCHPVFAPGNLSENQTIILCEGRGKKAIKELESIFKNFKIVKMTAEEHDKTMAIIQGLQHFLSIVFAKTINDSNIKKNKLLEVASPIYRIQIDIISRILSQDKKLFSHIVYGTQYSKEIIKTFIKNANILTKDFSKNKFENYFSEGKEFFGNYCQQGKIESDFLIDNLSKLLTEKNTEKVTSNIEKKTKDKDAIAVLGPKNTWSYLAKEKFLPNKKPEFCYDFNDIINNIYEEKIIEGFIPIENKITGMVREVWNDINEKRLVINRVYEFKINHVAVGLSKKNIKNIFGHEVALRQCSKFLKEEFPNAKLVKISSTAQAVLIAEKEKYSMAICSKNAKSKLNILYENISNKKNNATRFALISKKQIKMDRTNNIKNTSLFFILKNQLGELNKVLDIFSKHKKNMTKLESIPTGDNFSEYGFFVDIEGEFSTALENKLKMAVKKLNIIGKEYDIIK